MVPSASANSVRKPLNAGTTMLIRYRCEGAVRSALLRWGGLPVGGTSAAAFLVALLVWIPEQLSNLNLAGLAQDSLRSYVEDAVAGHGNMREKLNSIVGQSVEKQAKEAVSTQLGTAVQEPVKQAFASRVESVVSGEVEQILKSKGMRATMGEAVAAALKSNDHKVLLSAIQPKLKSIAQRLSQTIAKNSGKIVEKVSLSLPEHLQINKGNYRSLQRVLADLKDKGPPQEDFALRFYVAAEMELNNNYEYNMIRDYLSELGGVLGENLRFVLVLDGRKQFVALTEIDGLRTLDDGELKDFAGILNNKAFSRRKVLEDIKALFGPASVVRLDGKMKLGDVLRRSLWRDFAPHRHMAVLKEDGSFDGLTTRDRMLEALLP